jgi:hypothetical protein
MSGRLSMNVPFFFPLDEKRRTRCFFRSATYRSPSRLIIASYVANREGSYGMEKRFGGILVVAMVFTVFYGVLKLRQMQTTYDAKCPPKAPK